MKNPAARANLLGKKKVIKTIAKKPAKAQRVARDPARDKRSNSRLLHVAVEVGNRETKQKKSHKDGSKRISVALLPRKSEASAGPRGGPRGAKALTQVLQDRLKPGSDAVADEWPSTPIAVEAAGSNMLGTVVHQKNFRNPQTSYHSNDAESEVSRPKHFLRMKYGFVRMANAKSPAAKDGVLAGKIAEYVFYTNVGREMSDIMRAFRHWGGVRGGVCGW